MDKLDAYKYIKEIADQKISENETINRADLAFMLRDKLGDKFEDGTEISELTYEAYEKYGRPNSIRKAILTNDGSKSLVEQYELNAMIAIGDTENALEIVRKDMDSATARLEEARQSIKEALKIELAKDASNLYAWLQGTEGINELKKKGSILMHNYSKMVENYQTAKASVKNDIHDFVQLRSDVSSQYLQYATALIDIFGDSIKMVDPKLFDFNEIKWLDVTCMKKHTQLEYDKLDEKCTLLLGEIAGNFSTTLGNIPTWMKAIGKTGGKSSIYGTLAVSVFTYMNHWMDAQAKTNLMKDEYVRFENSIKKDRTQINGDLLRLATIHKTINELYIPKADTFARLSTKVLSADLQQLIDSIYNAPEIKPLKEKRDQTIARLSELNTSISDHNENITLYNSQIEDWQGMLVAQKGKYEEAKNRMPKQPNTIIKLLTLGHAQTKYEAEITDWNNIDGKLVEEYEQTIVDVEISKEDQTSHSEQLKKETEEYEKSRKELIEYNRQIAEKIRNSNQTKREALKHLKDIISLLNVAKNIMNSELDENLTQVTSINTSEQVNILSPEMGKDVKTFIENIKKEIGDKTDSIKESVIEEFGLDKEDHNVSEQTEKSIKNVSMLIDGYMHLQSDQMKAQLSSEIYEKEMEKLKKSFKEEISKIDKKSEILRESIKRANTAHDVDSLRRALIELGDKAESDLTETDFEAMLRGEKTIEI